jgi:hypothetical protein
MRFSYLVATIVLLSFVNNTSARVVSGKCASPPILADFDATKVKLIQAIKLNCIVFILLIQWF